MTDEVYAGIRDSVTRHVKTEHAIGLPPDGSGVAEALSLAAAHMQQVLGQPPHERLDSERAALHNAMVDIDELCTAAGVARFAGVPTSVTVLERVRELSKIVRSYRDDVVPNYQRIINQIAQQRDSHQGKLEQVEQAWEDALTHVREWLDLDPHMGANRSQPPVERMLAMVSAALDSVPVPPGKVLLQESFVEKLAGAVNDALHAARSPRTMWSAHMPWSSLDDPCRRQAIEWTRRMLAGADFQLDTPVAQWRDAVGMADTIREVRAGLGVSPEVFDSQLGRVVASEHEALRAVHVKFSELGLVAHGELGHAVATQLGMLDAVVEPASQEVLAKAMFEASRAVSREIGSEPLPVLDRGEWGSTVPPGRQDWWMALARTVLDNGIRVVPSRSLPPVVSAAELAKAFHEARASVSNGAKWVPIFLGVPWDELDARSQGWFEEVAERALLNLPSVEVPERVFPPVTPVTPEQLAHAIHNAVGALNGGAAFGKPWVPWEDGPGFKERRIRVAEIALSELPGLVRADTEESGQFAARMDALLAEVRAEVESFRVEFERIANAVGMGFGSGADASAMGPMIVEAIGQFRSQVLQQESMSRGMVMWVADYMGLPAEVTKDPLAFGDAVREATRRDAVDFKSRVTPERLARLWLETPSEDGGGFDWEHTHGRMRTKYIAHATKVIEALSGADPVAGWGASFEELERVVREGRKQGVGVFFSRDEFTHEVMQGRMPLVDKEKITDLLAGVPVAPRAEDSVLTQLREQGEALRKWEKRAERTRKHFKLISKALALPADSSPARIVEVIEQSVQGSQERSKALAELRLSLRVPADQSDLMVAVKVVELIREKQDRSQDLKRALGLSSDESWADMVEMVTGRTAQDAELMLEHNAFKAIREVLGLHARLYPAGVVDQVKALSEDRARAEGHLLRLLNEFGCAGLAVDAATEQAVQTLKALWAERDERAQTARRMGDAAFVLAGSAGIEVGDPVEVVMRKAGDAAAILRSWPDVARAAEEMDSQAVTTLTDRPGEVASLLEYHTKKRRELDRYVSVVNSLERLLAAHRGEVVRPDLDTVYERVDNLVKRLLGAAEEAGQMFGLKRSPIDSALSFAVDVQMRVRNHVAMSPSAMWASFAEQIAAKLEAFAKFNVDDVDEGFSRTTFGASDGQQHLVHRQTLEFAASVVRAHSAALVSGGEVHSLVMALESGTFWAPGSDVSDLELVPDADGDVVFRDDTQSDDGKALVLSASQVAPVGAALLALSFHHVREAGLKRQREARAAEQAPVVSPEDAAAFKDAVQTSLISAQQVAEAAQPSEKTLRVLTQTQMWTQGPNALDANPGKRWHVGCGGEVLPPFTAEDKGTCEKCGQVCVPEEGAAAITVTEVHMVRHQSKDSES